MKFYVLSGGFILKPLSVKTENLFFNLSKYVAIVFAAISIRLCLEISLNLINKIPLCSKFKRNANSPKSLPSVIIIQFLSFATFKTKVSSILGKSSEMDITQIPFCFNL